MARELAKLSDGMREFINNLRDRRQRLGLTQRQLSQSAGLSISHVSQIESARIEDPGFSTLIKLANALGTTANELAPMLVDDEMRRDTAEDHFYNRTPKTFPRRTVEHDDPYPNRAVAIQLAKGTVDANVVDAVRSISNSSGDLSVDEWMATIVDYQRRLKRLQVDLETKDDAAPQPPRDLSLDRLEKLVSEADAKRRAKKKA